MEEINEYGSQSKFVVFKLGNEEYGIDIQKITTILKKYDILPEFLKLLNLLKGVINLKR